MVGTWSAGWLDWNTGQMVGSGGLALLCLFSAEAASVLCNVNVMDWERDAVTGGEKKG
jgi:hypothetical protein